MQLPASDGETQVAPVAAEVAAVAPAADGGGDTCASVSGGDSG